MKKIFLFAVALLMTGALTSLAKAQNGAEYPQSLGYEYEYTLAGVTRSYFTSKMVKQIAALESARQDTLSVTARRWYSSGWEGSTSGYGYDTIARYIYKNNRPVLVEDSRFESEEYKNVLWSLAIEVVALSATDTAMFYTFNYYSTNLLSFNTEADTSYSAYAGRPYMLQQVNNPLQLPLTYISSNQNVAKVDQKGRITVAGKGETMIKAAFAGDDDINAVSAEWKLVVKEGDYFELEIMALERTEHVWGSGSTYLGFDMVKVTSSNCADILGDGKLSFDIETRTLTMNNFHKEFTEEEDNSMGWMDWLDYKSGPLPLNIKIVGNCYILHNSAGMFTDWDINIIGDGKDKSRLTLEGRFPQLSAANKIIIDGVQVHAKASTPHPLMICDTLQVEDNSYFEAYMDIYVSDPSEDPRQWGAMVGQVQDVKFGENIIMLSKEVHIENGAFVDGNGRAALRVEIGPKAEKVIGGDITFSAVELTDDPTGTEVDGILYTLTENDVVDKTEGCLVIQSTTSVEDVSKIIDELTPGSAAFAEKYNGLSFLLPVGTGNINIDLQTLGNYRLAVQIGKNAPVLLSQATKGVVAVPYNCSIATFAYIYAVAVSGSSSAPAVRRVSQEEATGSVKLYSLNLSALTGIEDIVNAADASAISKKIGADGQIYILRAGKKYNAAGIEVE